VVAYPGIQDDRKVLCSIWQDSNKVGLLSTIHDGTEWVVKNRKKLKSTFTQATITKQPFIKFDIQPGCKDLWEHSRLLPIPGQIDDYNHYMGGVDIADQLRAQFANWPYRVKPWRSLFYWLLGTTMTNAYILWNHQRIARLGLAKDKLRSGHRAFYKLVILALLVEPSVVPTEPTVPTQACRPNYQSLPPIRLTRPIGLHVRISKNRTWCFFCGYLDAQKREARKAYYTFTMPTIQGSGFTKYSCSHCKIALCINCFEQFHYYID